MEAKPERLQKILAAAGLASRRKAEELIAAGLVSVNGHVVTEPGTKADPRLDEIRVEGKLLRGPERHVYLAMYKPKGHMTTVSDPEGRPTVMDLLKGVEERVFPVGRLDYMSEGLLLLTNDGDLMAQLTRAGSHVAKTYMVKVSGKPTDEALDKLRNGIMLPPEPGLAGARGKKQPGVERRSFAVLTQPAVVQLAVDQENPWYEVTLTEGRNRQLRRMFEQIGHHIEKIKRIRYGSLTLDLEPGEFRHLTPKEVSQLRKSLETPFKPKPIKVKRKGARPERPERLGRPKQTPRIDSARFVKGRRGKPSAEIPAAAPAAAASSAQGAPPARRPFAARQDRRPAGGFAAPRGPEFTREPRRDEGFASKRRFPPKPAAEFDSERGTKRETRREARGESRGETRSETRREARRTPASAGGFGFDKFTKPGFSKPGFTKPGFTKPGSTRQTRGKFGTPRDTAGGAGSDQTSGYGERKSFGKRPYAKERAAAGDRGPAGKPGGFAAGRRFSKGPGKPERSETRAEGGFKRGDFQRGEFRRGDFERGGEARSGDRGSKPGKAFGARPAGAAPARPGGGDFKRGDFKRSGGGFKPSGGGGFKRPGSSRGPGRTSPPARGGSAPRPPRRRPDRE